MATHSSTLAWKIPWTEKLGRLQSMGSLGVGHDRATSLSLSCIGEGNGNPLQYSCLENPRDGRAWWAAVYGVAQSRTRLKRLSSTLGEEKSKMKPPPKCGKARGKQFMGKGRSVASGEEGAIATLVMIQEVIREGWCWEGQK